MCLSRQLRQHTPAFPAAVFTRWSFPRHRPRRRTRVRRGFSCFPDHQQFICGRLPAVCQPAASSRPSSSSRPCPRAGPRSCACLAASRRLPLDHHRRSIHAHQHHSFASCILLRQNTHAAPAMTRGFVPAHLPPGLPAGRRTDASFEASGDRAHLAPRPFGASRFTRRWHAH